MRRWFPFLFLIIGLYIFSKINRARVSEKNPVRKRISETVTAVTLALLIVYVVAFVYWLVTSVF